MFDFFFFSCDWYTKICNIPNITIQFWALFIWDEAFYINCEIIKKEKSGTLGLGLESLLKSENVKKILLILEKMRRGSNTIVHKINQLWYHVEIEQNWTDLYEKLWRIKKLKKKLKK